MGRRHKMNRQLHGIKNIAIVKRKHQHLGHNIANLKRTIRNEITLGNSPLSSNFQINRQFAVNKKEAAVTGVEVPSITIAVDNDVRNSCGKQLSQNNVANISGSDVLDQSVVYVGTFGGSEPAKAEIAEEVIDLECEHKTSETTKLEASTKQNEDSVIILEDLHLNVEVESSDTDSDVVFMGKRKLSYIVENMFPQRTGNLDASVIIEDKTPPLPMKSAKLESFIPLLGSSQAMTASEAISRVRKAQEQKDVDGDNLQRPKPYEFIFRNLTTKSDIKKINDIKKATISTKSTAPKKLLDIIRRRRKFACPTTDITKDAKIETTVDATDNVRKQFSNIYNVGTVKRTGLREIIIDGTNVAMRHSNGKHFSVEGLKICIDYFLQRGHKVTAFIPQFRLKSSQSSNPPLLQKLCDLNHVVCTPSREVNRKFICSYDDRFIVECAAILEGVIVSSDNFRDLWKENPNLKETIEKRLLMPTFVGDMIIFPNDPLGRGGPNLETFLKFPQTE